MVAKESHSCVAITVGNHANSNESGVSFMTFFEAKQTDSDETTESVVEASAVEAQIRELAQLEVATLHRSPETHWELGDSNIGALMQRIAGYSVAEINRLTSELHSLREMLQSEGARVQREITEYAHLSQSAMQSAEIISQRLANWRNNDVRARSD
jgi:uncharacterized protein YfcZ (UPF0381/DUF406 family)